MELFILVPLAVSIIVFLMFGLLSGYFHILHKRISRPELLYAAYIRKDYTSLFLVKSTSEPYTNLFLLPGLTPAEISKSLSTHDALMQHLDNEYGLKEVEFTGREMQHISIKEASLGWLPIKVIVLEGIMKDRPLSSQCKKLYTKSRVNFFKISQLLEEDDVLVLVKEIVKKDSPKYWKDNKTPQSKVVNSNIKNNGGLLCYKTRLSISVN